MKKFILLLLFISTSSFGQSLEFFISGCSQQQECKKCPPDLKITLQVNKINQTVIHSDTEIISNKTNSKVLENCSIVDERNFICGFEKSFTRSDGGITILDDRTIVRDGKFVDKPHIKYMDKNAKITIPDTPRKLCLFKKTLFGSYESIN
jgi:hypothetical protein